MNKVAPVSLVFLALAACGQPDAGSEAPAEERVTAAESNLTTTAATTSCDQVRLFVKLGLAQDMRDTLAKKFTGQGNEVTVPGALIAHDGFGGDMIHTVLGASATAERVYDPNPGGPFSAHLDGSNPTGSKFQQSAFNAAKALFDAMARGVQSSATQGSVTTVTRKSKHGRFECVVVKQGTSVLRANCSFTDLLMFENVSLDPTGGFCVN